MNTNKQPPSGIDYFAFFKEMDNEPLLPLGSVCFNLWSGYFWNVARNISDDTNIRHKMFRLLWLGDWLAVQKGLKAHNASLTPLNALHCYLILRDNRSAADVARMSVNEMEQALAEEWNMLKEARGARDFLRNVENRLDYLDDPFRGKH